MPPGPSKNENVKKAVTANKISIGNGYFNSMVLLNEIWHSCSEHVSILFVNISAKPHYHSTKRGARNFGR